MMISILLVYVQKAVYDLHSASSRELIDGILDVLQGLHLAVHPGAVNRKRRSIIWQAPRQIFEDRLVMSPLFPQLLHLLLLGGRLALGLGDSVSFADGSASSWTLLLDFDRLGIDPSMAARHVVLAIVGAAEAVAGKRAVAWWVVA